MAQDPVRIVRPYPGQGYAEGLSKLPETLSTAMDSVMKGALGLGSLGLKGAELQLGTQELQALKEKNILDAANEATRLRVLDQTRRDKQEYNLADIGRDLEKEKLDYLTDKRNSTETARHNMEVETLNADKLAETKAQNIKVNRQKEIAEIRDAIRDARADGDMPTAMAHAKMLSGKTGDLTEYRTYAGYDAAIKRFTGAFDEYQLADDADLPTRLSYLDTARMHSLNIPPAMRDKVPSYEVFQTESTDLRNANASRNALVKFLETPNTMLARLLPQATIQSYIKNAENVSGMIDVTLLQTQIGQDVASIVGTRDTKLKALFDIEKEVVKAAVAEGGPGVAGSIMQTFQQMRNSVSTQPETGGSDIQGILTKEQLKAQETPVTTAGVGGKIYFQSQGSDKVQLIDKSRADELTKQGKGQIVGQAGTPIEDVQANQVIYDMDGNRYKVATIAEKKYGAGFSGAGAKGSFAVPGFATGPSPIGLLKEQPATVKLAKVDKAGKMELVKGRYTMDQIKSQFSSTKPVKPDPLSSLKKEYEIPIKELKARYSISEADAVLKARKEAELGQPLDQLSPAEQAQVRQEIDNLLRQAGY